MGKHITDLPAEIFGAIITQIGRFDPLEDYFEGIDSSGAVTVCVKEVGDYLYTLGACRGVNKMWKKTIDQMDGKHLKARRGLWSEAAEMEEGMYMLEGGMFIDEVELI